MMKEKMDVQKAVELLQGLYAGRLDGEEQELAEELLKDEGVRRVYEELGDDETLVEELRRYGQFNPVRGRIVFEKRLQRQRALRWMKRLAAAACVVAALGGSFQMVLKVLFITAFPFSKKKNDLAELPRSVRTMRARRGGGRMLCVCAWQTGRSGLSGMICRM